MDEAADEEKEILCGQLVTVNESVFFLILIIFATLLSFWAVLIQRGQLVNTIEGNTEAATDTPPVYPIRVAAGALIVGSLGYFLSTALSTCRTVSEGTDCVAQRSAGVNV